MSVVLIVGAPVVEPTVNPDPVSLLNPSSVETDRTLRKGAGHLDPPSLLLCNCSDLIGNLREILILTHDKCHVVVAAVSKCDHIECDSHVDPLLLYCSKNMLRPVGQLHRSGPVSERPAKHIDSLAPHRRELMAPERVPSRVVFHIGNTCVEVYFG